MLLDRDERWMISSTRSYSPSPEPKLCKTEDPQPHYIPQELRKRTPPGMTLVTQGTEHSWMST